MSDDKHRTDEDHEGDESPGKPRIKVTDRRLFDEHGNLRSTDEETGGAETRPPAEEPPPAAGRDDASMGGGAPEPDGERHPSNPAATSADAAVEPPAPPAAPDPTPSADAATAVERPGQPVETADHPAEAAGHPTEAAAESDVRPPGAREAHSAADLPRDLAGFVESQYFETLLYLGAIPHPATGEVIEDADMAQYKIDLLNMLKEKTEGNRTPEETRLFDEVLYQLRMAFLQKSKVAKL